MIEPSSSAITANTGAVASILAAPRTEERSITPSLEIVVVAVWWAWTSWVLLEPLKSPAPERIENPTGERRASSTVNVRAFSPSHAIRFVLPLPPVA